MAQPDVVARAVEAMRRATSLRVTVKHRIGIDGLDRYEDMERFVSVVAAAAARRSSYTPASRCCRGSAPRRTARCRR